MDIAQDLLELFNHEGAYFSLIVCQILTFGLTIKGLTGAGNEPMTS